ncbi:MAG: hypothetical protein SF028_15315 [Candidatus Sumerlaeia bacterium]|nr:hypothetical protein [Candidatus Sumerlaeia bacterium]
MIDTQPVTELSNPLTEQLDTASPEGFARLLRQADAQIFAGWREHPSLADRECLLQMARFSERLARVFAAKDQGAVVLSGAGTSGRLAVFLAKELNRQLRVFRLPEVFSACVAGGEAALIQPVEGAEDRAAAAVEELKALLRKETKVGLFVGISAGLSAPYIAAQLESLRPNAAWAASVLGFNPLSQARATRAEADQISFADALAPWSAEPDRFFPLTPVYGPEALRGSTRLKGGTSTKMLLEVCFQLALELRGIDEERPALPEPDADPDREALVDRLRMILSEYREALESAYADVSAVGSLVKLGGNALRSAGRIYYLARGTAGRMAMLDAAECPPTFGADPGDVRAFLQEGWGSWLEDGRDLATLGKNYTIDLESFEESFLPEVSRGDLVVVPTIGPVGDRLRGLLEACHEARAKTAVVWVSPLAPKPDERPDNIDLLLHIHVPALGFRPGYFNMAETALKLVLNALTTGAHAMSGRIYGNSMIDLRLSNTKLYARSVKTIQTLLGLPAEQPAAEALHRAVFQTDTPTPEQLAAPPMEVVKLAGERRGIVPRALLIGTGKFTCSEAGRALADDPVVRRAVMRALTG